MSIADFSKYPQQSWGWLEDRLAEVASQLANAFEMLASAQSSERSARVSAFMSSLEPSVAGRERDAEAQSLGQYTAVMETQGRIKALTEERDLLRLLLNAYRYVELDDAQ